MKKRHSLLLSFQKWRKAEKGVAEAYAAIIVLPIMMALIFLLAETGFEIHYRSNVDSVVQEAVRGISLEGGDYNPRTSTFAPMSQINAYSNSTTNTWSSRAQGALVALCATNGNYSIGRCTQAPTVYCSPLLGAQGDQVSCTATFYYRPISSLSSQTWSSFGLSAFLTKPIVITMVSTISGGA